MLFYWAILYVLLIGFSVFLLLSRTPETKKALVHGVGTRLALSNYLMVLWAVFWILDRPLTFILGTATLGVIALLLLFNALVLAVRYPPSAKHPLDWLFIHVPIKMFLVITLQYDLWQQLFMALGYDFGSGGHDALVQGLWPAFGIVAGLGVFSALWIFATADLTWTAAGIYLNIGLLWHKHFSLIGGRDDGEPRPAPLTAAIILSISLQAVALVAGVAWRRIKARQEGRIALPLSPEEEAAVYRAEAERNARAAAAAAPSSSQPQPNASARVPGASKPAGSRVSDIAEEEAAAESSGPRANQGHQKARRRSTPRLPRSDTLRHVETLFIPSYLSAMGNSNTHLSWVPEQCANLDTFNRLYILSLSLFTSPTQSRPSPFTRLVSS